MSNAQWLTFIAAYQGSLFRFFERAVYNSKKYTQWTENPIIPREINLELIYSHFKNCCQNALASITDYPWYQLQASYFVFV